MDKPNYYSVIPAEVRYDNELKANEKLLYGEVTALANKRGYCNASNSYFADLYGKHKDTISDWINNLSKKGYIKTELIKDNLGRVEERRIYLSAKTPMGYRQKCPEGIGENTEGNNTSINNKKEKEEEIKNIISFYENNVALITPFVAQEIESYIEDGMQEELIISCMQEAVSRNKRNWKYIKTILNDCLNNNIKTTEQFNIKQKEFKSRNNKTPQKDNTKEKVEYEEVVFEDEKDYQNKLFRKE